MTLPARSRSTFVLIMSALAACAAVTPAVASADRYTLVHGCYGLRAAGDGRFVVKDALGYRLGPANVAAATPFRMQATALGSYLLYGPGGAMPATDLLDALTTTTTPGPDADWRVVSTRGRLHGPVGR